MKETGCHPHWLASEIYFQLFTAFLGCTEEFRSSDSKIKKNHFEMGHKLWISFIIVLNIEPWFDQFLFFKGRPKMKKTELCWGVSLIIHDLNDFIAFVCEMVQWIVWEIKDKSWLIWDIESRSISVTVIFGTLWQVIESALAACAASDRRSIWQKFD